MIESFKYNSLGGRVIFGAGSLRELLPELERLKLRKAVVVSTPEQIDLGRTIEQLIKGHSIGLFPRATMHTPVSVTEEALAFIMRFDADSIVAVGGGSTIGLSKAIALRTGLPQIVMPTTYAGSEVTPILGETQNGIKKTQRTPKVLPEVVIYDVNLTVTLPVPLSVTSGLNAIAHAAEALYARDRNPIITMLAESGIRSLAGALPQIFLDPTNIDARSDAQLGAWLCGLCLGGTEMALHHKLCHTLGGTFNLPHAETHCVILPHALAYNLPAVPIASEQLARALGDANPARYLQTLASQLAAPISLRELGMQEKDIESAAELAVENAYWNPRSFSHEDVKAILFRAWSGLPPE